MAYWNQGRRREAEELQAKEFEICQKVLGEEHPDTLTSMANLAFIFKGQGRNEEAMALMKDCTRMRKQVLGSRPSFYDVFAGPIKRVGNWEFGLESFGRSWRAGQVVTIQITIHNISMERLGGERVCSYLNLSI
jgi:Tetratricopeptide repeat